ncbi:putative reverse transcriptase domain-containing protein [Tanacetum coccineum]
MPRILIPLRPILGVLQIGIKSQDTIIADSQPLYGYIHVPPSPDYIPGPEGPPSPDYVPGPEEPEQAPPSPIYIPFVPEPVYPEFLPGDDEVFPAEEQPMPAADSPTHQSPGYIPESDPEEDLEEDDEEDPEEDPADYPADRGDDDDDDAEEEELRFLPKPCSCCLIQLDQDPFHCLRAVSYYSGPGYEVGESSAAGTARQFGPATARTDLYGFAEMLDAAPGRQTDSGSRLWCYGLLGMTFRWMLAYHDKFPRAISLRTTVRGSTVEITELKAAEQFSMGPGSETAGTAKESCRAELPEEASKQKMAQEDRPNEVKSGTTPPPVTDPTTTTLVTSAQLQAMIDEVCHAVFGAVLRPVIAMISHTFGKGHRGSGRLDPVVREDGNRVSHKTVTNEVAYAMTWSDVKKKMTTKYCPRNEIKKIEAELWNLKVQGTDVVAYNQRFQELALLM